MTYRALVLRDSAKFRKKSRAATLLNFYMSGLRLLQATANKSENKFFTTLNVKILVAYEDMVGLLKKKIAALGTLSLPSYFLGTHANTKFHKFKKRRGLFK